MYDAVAMGELLIDFAMLSRDEEGYPTMAAHPGGAPANYLAAMSALGMKTAFIGKAGSDMFGRMLISTLASAGIETSGILCSDKYFTTLAFVTIDETGNRDFSFARKGSADVMLEFDEVDLSLIKDTKVFHFGTLSTTDEPVRSTTHKLVAFAKENGVLISFDPNLRKPLWSSMEEARQQMLYGLSQADVVKISDEEVDFLWGLSPEEGAEKIRRDFGVKLVFVTCGADGAVYANENALGRVPGLCGISVTDTTGAGDIFGGSAMSMILRSGKAPDQLSGDELRDITAFACTAASLSTTRPGGISSVPDEADVLARLRSL